MVCFELLIELVCCAVLGFVALASIIYVFILLAGAGKKRNRDRKEM